VQLSVDSGMLRNVIVKVSTLRSDRFETTDTREEY
jgi:hypothetical protein